MLPYLLGAAAALAVAGYMFWQSKQATGQVSRFVTTENVTAADVHALAEAAATAAGAGAFAHRVELSGVAVPGERGLLTSEVTDTQCLWYRQKVTHHFQETRRNKDGHDRTSNEEDVISDVSSKQPFGLRDDTGEITLVPTARVNGPRKTASEFRPTDQRKKGTKIEIGSFSMTLPGSSRGDRTLGYEYEEWVLLPDTRIFVSGEAFDDRGRLEVRGPTGPDRMLISTRSEEELVAHHRGETRKNQLFAGLAVAAAVVLVVLAFVLP